MVAKAESFVKLDRGNATADHLYVQRDRDQNFTKSFNATLKRLRVKMKHDAFRSPNPNAFVERLIQSSGHEYLDRIVMFEEQHIDHVCHEYLSHYHGERPQQSLQNEPTNHHTQEVREAQDEAGIVEDEIVSLSEIRCKQQLGGLLKSYGRET